MSQSTAHLALASLKHKYQSLIQRHGALLRAGAGGTLALAQAEAKLLDALRKLAHLEDRIRKQDATIGTLDTQIEVLRYAQPALLAKLRSDVKFHQDAWYTLSKRTQRAEGTLDSLRVLSAVLGSIASVSTGYLVYLTYFA